MKIYFRSTSKDKIINNQISDSIKDLDHKINASQYKTKNKDTYSSNETDNILKHDLFIIEASEPSSKAGFETAFAIDKGIPTIVLHLNTPNSKPFFPLIGIEPKSKLIIKGYKPEELEELIPQLIKEVEDYKDNRFTLELTPQISEFLNWISIKKKISRSNYIRSLIEAALKKNTDYKKFQKDKS